MSQGSDTAVSSQPPAPRPLDGLKVLVVEDHAVGRVLLEAMLGGLGVVVTAVGSGEEARAALVKARFDVALVDLGLPDIPGETLGRDLARLGGGAKPVVVAVTGRTRPSRLPVGFADWLEKPFSTRDLYDTLAAVVPPSPP